MIREGVVEKSSILSTSSEDLHMTLVSKFDEADDELVLPWPNPSDQNTPMGYEAVMKHGLVR